jgi:uncharacterized cupredoxin-like copper-binding protein
MKRALVAATLVALLGDAAARETAYGMPADPAKADRVIEIGMSDAMRFTPAAIEVKRGESIRFVVKNNGEVMHEMVLGTMKELREHAEMMKRHASAGHAMDHHEPSMAHVQPGKTGVVGWRFTRAGEFYFGCLVPGHFDAGMIGKVIVK